MLTLLRDGQWAAATGQRCAEAHSVGSEHECGRVCHWCVMRAKRGGARAETHCVGDGRTGYEDRFLGVIEVSVDGFDAAEIPLHRIVLFRRGSQVVWDRRAHLDLIFGA
jgi:hypothetical protein